MLCIATSLVISFRQTQSTRQKRCAPIQARRHAIPTFSATTKAQKCSRHRLPRSAIRSASNGVQSRARQRQSTAPLPRWTSSGCHQSSLKIARALQNHECMQQRYMRFSVFSKRGQTTRICARCDYQFVKAALNSRYTTVVDQPRCQRI